MISITLDRQSDVPLYAQLQQGILTAIRDGTLKPGNRLTTVASLAQEMKVTAATVRRAYEELSKEGLITSHVGRGTFVAAPAAPSLGAAAAPITGATAAPAAVPAATRDNPELILAARRLRMGVARSLEALEALGAKPGLIRFTWGVPPAGTLRDGLMEELARKVFAKGQDACTNYAPTAGTAGLRQAIADRFTAAGTKVTPEQVLITNGSQQAVSILAQSAAEDGRRILCEMPCYMGIARAFGAAGHWVESVTRDAEGPLPDQLAARGDGRRPLLYLCPELHNPMGTDATPQRRRAVIDWARRENGLIVADEIFRDLRCDNTTPPSMLAEAGADSAVAIGSLSKSFACGLRIGWLVSSAERVRSLTELKRAIDIGCPPLMQGIAEELLRSGEYDEHIRRVRKLYQIRRDAALRALSQHMPKCVTWTRPQGGFHLWVQLPPGYSSLALFMLAVERGVAISPGPMCDVDHRFVNCFRLSYGTLRPEQIDDGVQRIAAAAAEIMRHPPVDAGLSGMGGLL